MSVICELYPCLWERGLSAERRSYRYILKALDPKPSSHDGASWGLFRRADANCYLQIASVYIYIYHKNRSNDGHLPSSFPWRHATLPVSRGICELQHKDSRHLQWKPESGNMPVLQPQTKERRTNSTAHPTSMFQLVGVYRTTRTLSLWRPGKPSLVRSCSFCRDPSLSGHGCLNSWWSIGMWTPKTFLVRKPGN